MSKLQAPSYSDWSRVTIGADDKQIPLMLDIAKRWIGPYGITLLSSINKNNLEQVLTAFRHARATNAVASIQYESTQKGTDKITMDEINAEIGTVTNSYMVWCC